jgi:large subunit ribosomal protein L4
MKTRRQNLDGGSAGEIELADAIFGIETSAGHPAALRHLAARQAPRRHAQDPGPQRESRHRQEDVQAEGHRRRPSRLAPAAQFVGGAKAHGPVVRSHEFDLPKKVRAGAAHALSSKAKAGGLAGARTPPPWPTPKTAALRATSQARLKNALVIAGAEVDGELRWPRATSRVDVLPNAGPQRLRHPAPRHPGADQGDAIEGIA